MSTAQPSRTATPWPVWMGFITQEEHDELPDDHPGDDSPYITG